MWINQWHCLPSGIGSINSSDATNLLEVAQVVIPVNNFIAISIVLLCGIPQPTNTNKKKQDVVHILCLIQAPAAGVMTLQQFDAGETMSGKAIKIAVWCCHVGAVRYQRAT